MNEFKDRFYDEAATVKATLSIDAEMGRDKAEELLDRLLHAHAAMLADQIENQQMPMAMMAMGGNFATSWRRGSNDSAELIRPKGEVGT